MGEALIFTAISSACALLFIGIGIFSINKKAPMHFWAGTTVKTEEIKDVKAYNRANGIMWIVYGSTFVLSSIIEVIFQNGIGAGIMAFCCIFGLVVIVVAYYRIYNKYKA